GRDEFEEALLRAAVRGPEIRGGQLARALELRIRVPEQYLELGREPRPLVDAVRDRGDRDLVDALVGPDAVPHLAGDGAVQLGDGVRVLRGTKRERGQAEAGLAGLHPAEREEVLPRQAATLDE